MRHCNAKGLGSAAPTILTVGVPADGDYNTAQNLDFVFTFSEPIVVTGSPQVAVGMTSGAVVATYLSGSGTSALTFRYTVQVADSEATGITLESPISLNGGTLKDLGGMDAVLTFVEPDLTGVTVNQP